jgi:hypothetical protein
MIPSSTIFIRTFGSYSAKRRHEIDILNCKLERLTIALFGKKALEYFLQIKEIKPTSYSSFTTFFLTLLLYIILFVPVIVCTEIYVFIKLVIYSLRNSLYSKEYETLHEILENPYAVEQANYQDDYNSLIAYLRQEFEEQKLNKDYLNCWAMITILTFKGLKTCFSASSSDNVDLEIQRNLYLVVGDDIVKKLQLPTYEEHQELLNTLPASQRDIPLNNRNYYYQGLFASPQVQRLPDSSLNDTIYFCTEYGVHVRPKTHKYTTDQGWRIQAIPSELHLRKERQKFLKGLNLFFSDAALQCIQPNIERYLERLEVPSVIEPAVLPGEVSAIVASFF